MYLITGPSGVYIIDPSVSPKKTEDFCSTIPDLKGKKTLTFRIYYIGREYFPRRGKKVHGYKYADPGSVLEIYEMGFNAKPKFSKNKK